MIDRDGRRELYAECDTCGTSTEGRIAGVADWREFVAELKAAGWRIRKDDESGVWEHFCEGCGDDE